MSYPVRAAVVVESIKNSNNVLACELYTFALNSIYATFVGLVALL